MLTDKASIKKGIRFWSVGILGGLLVMLGASLYFIDQEKKEAEARLYETAEYVKVQSSSVTHYNEALESQSLLRLIESVRQVGINLKAEKETGSSTEEALLQQNIRGLWLSGILLLDEKGEKTESVTKMPSAEEALAGILSRDVVKDSSVIRRKPIRSVFASRMGPISIWLPADAWTSRASSSRITTHPLSMPELTRS